MKKIQSLALLTEARGRGFEIVIETNAEAKRMLDLNGDGESVRFQEFTFENQRLLMFKADPLMMLVVITVTDKISEANQEQMFKDLCIKMKSLWGQQIIPDTSLAKKFKRDLDVFVQERDYMVVQDKVAVAQQKVYQTKQIAQENVTKLYENTTILEEKLLPTSLDLKEEA